jgi:hypothetical protein
MNYDINKDLLPVGSIVKIRFSKKLYMITGFYTKDSEDNIYDYSAVEYPIGFHSFEDIQFFQRDYVKTLINLGFVTDKEKEFKSNIKKVDKKKTSIDEFIEF